MLVINIDNPRSSVRDPRSIPDLLVGITADIEILADGNPIYAESDFPILELAYHLARWIKVPPQERPDFVLDSMESDEVGLVRILGSDEEWSIGSVHELSAPPVRPLAEVDDTIREFLAQVSERCRKEWNIDVTKVLS